MRYNSRKMTLTNKRQTCKDHDLFKWISEDTQISNKSKVCAAWLVVLVMTIAGGYTEFSLFSDSKNLAVKVAHTDKVLMALQTVYAKILKAESVTRAYTLTKDEKFLELREAAAKQSSAALDQVQELTAENTQQQASLTELRKLLKDRFEFLKHYLLLQKQNLLSEDEIKEFVETGAAMTVTLEKQIEEIQSVEASLLTQRESEFINTEAQLQFAMMVFIGISLAMAFVTFVIGKKCAS